MLIIKHRVNSVEELRLVPRHYGVEVDVHYYDSTVVVGHDPQQNTVSFDSYLLEFEHSFLAVNIKQEGIEKTVLAHLKDHDISNFFLFDLTFPSLMRTMMTGERRLALRISDFEDVKNLSFFKGKVDWVWIDIFQDPVYLEKTDWSTLSSFKKCLVSPELHILREYAISQNIKGNLSAHIDKFEAICTKDPFFWENL